MCTLVTEGGFGDRRLGIFNKAFLKEWFWRFACKMKRFFGMRGESGQPNMVVLWGLDFFRSSYQERALER